MYKLISLLIVLLTVAEAGASRDLLQWDDYSQSLKKRENTMTLPDIEQEMKKLELISEQYFGQMELLASAGVSEEAEEFIKLKEQNHNFLLLFSALEELREQLILLGEKRQDCSYTRHNVTHFNSGSEGISFAGKIVLNILDNYCPHSHKKTQKNGVSP